jgi:hypothetical protein
VNIDGNEYEAGGSIIHEKNLYMKRFADELGEIILSSYRRIFYVHI